MHTRKKLPPFAWRRSAAGNRLAARSDGEATPRTIPTVAPRVANHVDRKLVLPTPHAPVRSAPFVAMPPDWAAKAAGFVRRLAPIDLEGVSVYVVLTRDLPASWGWNRADLSGCVFGYLSEAAQPAIRDWRGPGAAIYINEIHRPVDEYEQPLWLLKLLLHEAAHFFDAPALLCHWRNPGAGQLSRTEAEAERARFATPSTADELANDDAVHGPKWLRAVAHVTARARPLVGLLGLPLAFGRTNILTADAVANRPNVRGLAAIVGNEVYEHWTTPISEIIKLPIPERLLTLGKRPDGLPKGMNP